MYKKFNNYSFYLDSDHSIINFNTMDEVVEHVIDIFSVDKKRVLITDNVDEKGHSNVAIKDKFGNLVRVVGFVYGSILD